MQIVELAKKAVICAGNIVMKYYKQEEKGLSYKESYNLLSQADIASEKEIVRIIKEQFPLHSLYTEETYRDTLSSENLWIIDPLDGTNNFVHRIPHFSISIAYAQNGRVVAGVVYNPVTRDMFTVKEGEGAYWNNKKVSPSKAKSLTEALVGVGFFYDRGKLMKSTLNTIEHLFISHIHGIRRFGSAAIDLCYVGCGILDAFFEYQLMLWDFAAGALFVKEAGGMCTDCNGKDVNLYTKSILATNGNIHKEMLDILKQFKPDI